MRFSTNIVQNDFLIIKTLITSTNDNELYPQNAFLISEHVPENPCRKVPARWTAKMSHQICGNSWKKKTLRYRIRKIFI